MAVQLSDKPEYVDYADVTVEALGFFFKLFFIRTKLFFFPFFLYTVRGSFLLESITGLGKISLTSA